MFLARFLGTITYLGPLLIEAFTCPQTQKQRGIVRERNICVEVAQNLSRLATVVSWFLLLFSMIFTHVFSDTLGEDDDISTPTTYHADGFNLRRLQAKTKVLQDVVRDFIFAEDCAVNISYCITFPETW